MARITVPEIHLRRPVIRHHITSRRIPGPKFMHEIFVQDRIIELSPFRLPCTQDSAAIFRAFRPFPGESGSNMPHKV